MSNDLFITEIDSTRRLYGYDNQYQDLDLLQNVRKEHNKVKEIVDSFKNKVDKLIDKQRQDYIQAYETHVQDVQKELLNLREKVFEIANDDTKNERTEKLKDDLKIYKQEAIQLEEGSDELRSTMARLVRELYSAEKSRDWLLKKLRSEKKRYNNLLKEKLRLYEENSLAGSTSNASAYTLEIIDPNPKKTTIKVNDKFKRSVRAHATVHRNVHLPKISDNRQSHTPNSANTASDDSRPLSHSFTDRYNLNRENELSQLVSLRACMQELRNFTSDCGESTHRRPWNRVEKRNFKELLNICLMITQAEQFPSNKEILPIVCELAAHKEVYEVIEDLLGPIHHL